MSCIFFYQMSWLLVGTFFFQRTCKIFNVFIGSLVVFIQTLIS